MEPFPVICETCQAKLRVKDPQIVGQIHACPKCDSMVHLVPPTDWTAPLAAAETSAAPQAKPAPASLDGNPSHVAKTVATSAATATRGPSALSRPGESHPSFAEIESLELSARPESRPSASAAVLPTVDAEANLAPELAGVSPAEVFWRQVAVWGAAGGAGLFVLGTLAGALWVRSERNEPKKAANPTPVTAAADHVDAQASVPTSSRATDENVPPASDDFPTASAEESEPKPPEIVAARPQLPPELVPAKSLAADRAVETATRQDSTTPTELSASSDPATVKSPLRQTFDLLSFDPAHLELAMGLAGDDGSLDSAPSEVPHSVLEPIDGPGREIANTESTGSSRAPADGESDYDDVPPAAADAGEDLSVPADALAPVRRGPLANQAVPARTVSQQLELPVESIDMSGVPLAQWLDVTSQLIDVPITLSPDALLMAGIAPDEPVNVRGEKTTAGELLAKVLAGHRLEFRERSGQLTIVSQGHERRRSVDYGVGDLLMHDDADASPIAALAQQMVRPGSWRSRGGMGRVEVFDRSIRVHHQQGVQLEVLVLLERLLQAREQPTKSRYPVDRLSIDPTYAYLAAQLDRRATFTLLAWTNLADVFRYWQQELGLTILVDWVSLADVQLEPKSPVACSIQNRLWKEALVAVLEPLELTWQAVDKNTIEITSRATAFATQRLEFYPVADLVRRKFSGPDALIREITNAIGDRLPSAVVDQTQLYFDEASNYLLVLGPADAQRFITERLTTP